MNTRKKFTAFILAVFMCVPMMVQPVFAEQPETFKVIFKTNADVIMGEKEYTVGEASNALPTVDELGTLFSDFLTRAKQKGNVYVKNPLWYEDLEFTEPANMPEVKAGEEYTVYCGFTTGLAVAGLVNINLEKSYSIVNGDKYNISPFIGAGISASNSRPDTYESTKVIFEKNTNDRWETVGDEYYTDYKGIEWPNMIYFKSVEDSGEYRIKHLKYTATDNNGDILYYDYAYDENNTIFDVTITPVELTISGVTAVNREYDGTDKVELTGGTLEGVLFDDDVDFQLGEGVVDNAEVGEGKAVTTNVEPTGEKCINYILKQPEDITVNIKPVPASEDNKSFGGSSHSLEEKKKDKNNDKTSDDKKDKNNDKDNNNNITEEINGQNTKDERQNFEDVNVNDWFYNDVTKANENGLMNGISNSKFNPNGYMTRAMAAVIIHNVENKPVPEDIASFLDVTSDKYYADAVSWAAESRIVNGYSDEIFAPDDFITREQMAVILYNYAQMKGREINSFAELDEYSDSDKVSDYAQEAVSWAVGNGYITGKGNGVLDPKGTATRAEMSSIIVRFLNI